MAKPIREMLLKVMGEYAGKPGFFQTVPILEEVATRVGIRGLDEEQALLTLWADMFRVGLVAPGYNLANAQPPHCHLTERGRAALKQLSRDPSNPDGYLAALKARTPVSPVVEGYVEEALSSYNAACFKAAAVMIGCASESLLLDVRDAVVARLGVHGRSPGKNLTDWRAKTVLDAVAAELGTHSKAMPTKLREAFQSNWPAFLQQLRASRNDAGHPSSIAPITPETVHASLLIFPELLSLAAELVAWIATSMP